MAEIKSGNFGVITEIQQTILDVAYLNHIDVSSLIYFL
jgi:hypothetical protein